MTSGAVGTAPSTGFLTNGVWYRRQWSGADGRSENYGGEQRPKWNNFALTTCSRLVTRDRFVLRRVNGSTFQVQPSYSGMYGFPAGFPSNNLQQQLLQKLSSKIKGSEFNLAVSLSQMDQTVNMLSQNLGKLGRAFLAVKRGDFSTAARQLNARPPKNVKSLRTSDVSGRWLELQYGWLPLLSDCYESAQLFENISNGPRSKLFRAKVWEGREIEMSQSPTNYSSKMSGKVTRYLQYEMYEEMSALRQMGLLDPLSVIWENIPYSFVVDWFIPIGKYLDNLNQIPSLKGRWLITDVWKTQRAAFQSFQWKLFGAYDSLNPQQFISSVVSTPEVRHGECVMTRTFSGAPPKVPYPTFNLSGAVRGKRFWNALSLAHQRFTGSKLNVIRR